MRVFGRLVGVAGLVAIALLGMALPCALSSAADAAQVTATFTPSSIDVASGRSRAVVLQVSNAGTSLVSDLRVTFTSDPGIVVTSDNSETQLAAAASMTVVANVKRSPGAPATASVEAIVSYRTGSVAGTTVTSLAVTTPAAASAAPARPIAVAASIGSATLIQYQSTEMFFNIANNSDRGQALSSVIVTYPDFLKVRYLPVSGDPIEGSDGRLTISTAGSLGPGDGMVVHLHVDADQPLQPGDALIVLTVAATDQVDFSTTNTFASQKITFSVLGESGVLTVLGVPALLFVPGIVFAVVLWALWTYVYPRAAFSVTGAAGFEGKVVMWVFALLPSLSFPFLYPIITSWFGPRRDYRTSYGLDDILYVWLMAAAGAFVTWALALVVRYLTRQVRRLGRHLFVPTRGDRPPTLLAKLARRPWRRKLSRETALYNQVQLVVILHEYGDKALVTPRIAYSNLSLTEDQAKKLADRLRTQPLRLWRFLRKHRAKVTLSYQPEAPLAGPTEVDIATLGTRSEGNLVTDYVGLEPAAVPPVGRVQAANGGSAPGADE